MGLLGRLFGGDPAKDLEKARQALERDPARALLLARRLADGELAGEAQGVIEKARTRLVDNALALAAEAESSEYFEDAAEWLDRALEQIDDESRRSELLARREALLDLAEAEEDEAGARPEVEPERTEGAQVAVPVDVEVNLEAFLDMMREDVAQRYREQDEPFRAALGDLLDGRVEAALAAFEPLVAEAPDDPVRRLERGRCRLLTEDFSGARDDFASAWEGLGEESLLEGHAESIPGLWADVQLTLGEHKAVIDRLEELAEPQNQRTDLAVPFAAALIAEERFEDAEAYLRRARRTMPSVHDLAHMHAGLSVRRGEFESAILILEGVVAPACAGGTCSPSALHVPSLRSLVALHQEHGTPARARELGVYLARFGDGQRVGTEQFQPNSSATVI